MIEALIVNIHIQSLILGLILATVFFKLTRKEIKLNEPPFVPYRFPIIGHTWSFLTDCEKLILESRKKYGESFSLYVFGQVITVVGKDSTQEVFVRDRDFNHAEANKPRLPLHYIFTYSPDMTKNGVVMKDWFTKKIDWLTTRLHSNIKAIDMYIGDCVEPKVIHDPVKVMRDIISIPFSSLAFGDECCHYDDILDIFRNLTASFSKLFVIPPLLAFIHPWLHQQFVTIPYRFGWNPYSKYRDTIIRRIRPVIEKRLNDRKRLGDDWVAPMDLLQVYLDNPRVTPDFDPNNVDINYIADSLGVYVLASMHTTSNRTATALYDLAWRKEYAQELYEEAQEINKQCNGNELTSRDFNKMVKLDSFIKESFRNFDDILGLPHICVVKSIYTFKNGYQIPKGRMVYLNFLDTHYDEEIQGPDPMKFYAFRHLERNASATKIERNLIIFGNGKHSCPGRFMAVNQIKMVLHKVILKYNVTTETGKIPPKRYSGPVLNRVYDGLVFERRKDSIN